jgi:hypothetical protein
MEVILAAIVFVIWHMIKEDKDSQSKRVESYHKQRPNNLSRSFKL